MADSLLAGPVRGYRGWSIVPAAEGGSSGWLLSGIGVGGPWHAREHGECRAECLAPQLQVHPLRVGTHRPDGAPDRECGCGLYLLKAACGDRGAIAQGTALGWGRLVEHASGWRCEWARPEHVRIDAHRLVLQQPGADPAEVAAKVRSRYRCSVEVAEGGADPPLVGRWLLAGLAAAAGTAAATVAWGSALPHIT